MIPSFAFLTGLIFGSFFNVLIYRVPEKKSILWPSSFCPKCKKSIKPWENIPVISYIFLGGRCSACKNRIPITYPAVELITAIFSVILWYLMIKPVVFNSAPWQTLTGMILYSVFLLLLIPVSVIDLKHYIIPDVFTLSMIAAGLIYSFLPLGITPFQSVIGLIGGGGVLYLTGWIGTVLFKKGEAMGGGDIKLMAAAGALFGLKVAFMGIVFGAFLGSIAGVAMLASKKISSDHHIPFGPFLGAGIWIAIFSGEQILEWYMNFVQNSIPLN
ncbi:MAG: prepilin peptidase [Fibrobacter sp.]|nr:prepilin peptidase [Fibrobacter sp.]